MGEYICPVQVNEGMRFAHYQECILRGITSARNLEINSHLKRYELFIVQSEFPSSPHRQTDVQTENDAYDRVPSSFPESNSMIFH